MKTTNDKKVITLCGLIFLLVGTILLAALLIMQAKAIPKADRVDTTAVITDIDSHGTAKNKHYDVIVSYTADGQQYRRELGYYSSSMREGETISIYYDRNNPERISAKGGDALLIFTSGFVAVFVLLGAALTVKGVRMHP